ncbi:hypothetical protein BP6252_02863 [Coleophoma cylindrospora]|uniref:Uncharacterized protein n=1 Tax=Coleophoma cylindrospora TaxID=1849047 RepID=A0A3D8SG78_9HELO|nr:hypothetical protein BP6252_02863 [Coleophoma cylindrospora]
MTMLPQKRPFDNISRAEIEPSDFEFSSGNYADSLEFVSLQNDGYLGLPSTSQTIQWLPNSMPPDPYALHGYEDFPLDDELIESVLGFNNGEIQGSSMIKVCFGMIHEVRAELWVGVERLEELLRDSPQDEEGNHIFQITKQGNNFVVLSQDLSPIAVINDLISVSLRSICDVESVQFQGLTIPESLDTAPKNRKSSAMKQKYITLNINIYGESRVRDIIGTTLSSAQVFLQHPGYKDYGCEYDNPHFVSIPNVRPKLTEASNEQERNGTAVNSSSVAHTAENKFQNEIAVVFNSLTRARCLKRLDADMRIKTRLLDHQKEALDFIAQREFGPVPPHFSLWRKVQSNTANEDWFEHSITGSRSQFPYDETGCGILADDMGLGKTLTCLATVTRTAQTATQFWESGRTLQEKDGSGAQNRRYAARATLVIVPTQILITSWTQEAHKHIYGSLDICIYHGRGREKNPEILAKADIVFTTYHTISTESLKSDSPLFQITWFRIVLDEAHMIRSVSTRLYQTASKLDGRLRWCLTGTPVQNKLQDIGSLISFLRVPLLDTAPAFKKHVIDPLMKETGAGSESLRILLDSICLRRSKNLLDLPDIDVNDRVLQFSDEEMEQYKSAELEMSKAIKHQANLESSKRGFFGIFQMEMRLRRLCNHGTYQKPFTPGLEAGQNTGSGFNTPQPNGDTQCDLCGCHMSREVFGDDLLSSHFTVCGHLLCSKCAPEFEHRIATAKDENGLQCPLCQARLAEDHFQSDNIATGEYFRDDGESSKIAALLEDIEKNKNRGKSIIFSCWTKSLDLIAKLFSARKISFERIDGSCSVSDRNKTLDIFRKSSAAQILMMTTGTGAVGLNLAVANFVYILEPQWNPMVESQAIARVSRLGQEKNVSVIRYIVKGTVEETMRSQQIRKLALADVGWRDDAPRPVHVEE